MNRQQGLPAVAPHMGKRVITVTEDEAYELLEKDTRAFDLFSEDTKKQMDFVRKSNMVCVCFFVCVSVKKQKNKNAGDLNFIKRR